MTVPAIILAAGDGSRLGALTARTPKPLIPVGGNPLIVHTIEALVEAGLTDQHIVVGDRAEAVRAALGDGSRFGARFTFGLNRRPQGGNGHSLACARAALAAPGVVVAMADHLVSPALIERLLDGDPSVPRLAVDYGIEEPWVLDEATLVKVGRDARITAIGKGLPNFDAVDTGVFYLTPDAAGYLDDDPALELATVIRRFLHRPGGFHACDVTGAGWWDVDTIADLAAAELRLAARRTAIG